MRLIMANTALITPVTFVIAPFILKRSIARYVYTAYAIGWRSVLASNTSSFTVPTAHQYLLPTAYLSHRQHMHNDLTLLHPPDVLQLSNSTCETIHTISIYIDFLKKASMSGTFPHRSESDYKGGMIWTDLSWSAADIPKSWLSTKFSLVMDSVPYPERWSTFIPTEEQDESFVGNYFAAGFGTKSMIEHKKVISVLTSIHKKDRLAFSHIVVIDARIEVLGDDFPVEEPAPFLVDHEILSGRRINRNPADGPRDEHFLENSKKRSSGTIVCDQAYIGFRKYKLYLCHEERMKPDLFLRYCRLNDHSINKELTHFQMMQNVHENHIKWLLRQREIPRECYISLRATYQNDKLLEKRVEERMIKILLKKSAKFEREMYHVGSASPEWHDLCFKDQMSSIYLDHKHWLLEQPFMNHTLHCRYSKVYKDDPFIPEETRKSFNNIINCKFGAFLHKIHDDPPSKMKQAAHRYWIEKIPVVKPDMPPLVPFDCW